MGPQIQPDGLTVTVGVGASLFDGPYGLSTRKPVQPTAIYVTDQAAGTLTVIDPSSRPRRARSASRCAS